MPTANLSQKQRSAAWRQERAYSKTWARTKPNFGIRPPDHRHATQGEPAELILRRLGFDAPNKTGGVPAALKASADPNLLLLRKLGFRDSDHVKVALTKVTLAA